MPLSHTYTPLCHLSPLPPLRKPGSVGRAQGSVQVTVLDSDNRPVPTGQVCRAGGRGGCEADGMAKHPGLEVQSLAPSPPLAPPSHGGR